MKLNTINNKILTYRGNVVKIDIIKTRNSVDMIMLTMKQGKEYTTFSNFKTVFDKLNFQVENINEGDELEIEYTQYICTTGKVYNNFRTIKSIKENNDETDLIDTLILENSHKDGEKFSITATDLDTFLLKFIGEIKEYYKGNYEKAFEDAFNSCKKITAFDDIYMHEREKFISLLKKL